MRVDSGVNLDGALTVTLAKKLRQRMLDWRKGHKWISG